MTNISHLLILFYVWSIFHGHCLISLSQTLCVWRSRGWRKVDRYYYLSHVCPGHHLDFGCLIVSDNHELAWRLKFCLSHWLATWLINVRASPESHFIEFGAWSVQIFTLFFSSLDKQANETIFCPLLDLQASGLIPKWFNPINAPWSFSSAPMYTCHITCLVCYSTSSLFP